MVSLNDVNTEVENKYGPFVVEDVEGGDVYLRNILRLTKNEREQVKQLDGRMKDAKAANDMNVALECAKDMVRLVAAERAGDRLLDALGDDPAKLMYVIELWAEATQPGEASGSEN